MDARERLRQYLEQRRELGETELVLDGMDVDEVLRVVGALRGAGTGPTASPQRPAAPGAAAPAAPRVEAAPDRPPAPRPPAEAPAAEPPTERPPVPPTEERDAARPAGDMGDWRAALRAAGGAPDQLTRGRGTSGAGTPSDPQPEDEMARKKAAQRDPGSPRADERTVPPKRTATGPVAERAAAGVAKGAARAAAAELPKWLAKLDVPAGLSVGTGAAVTLEPAIAKLRTLDAIAEAVEGCTRCPLYATATHGVPGEGSPDADFVCVGEAPGQNEDQTGRPFVGAAGQLLTKILAAIKLTREEVFIANVLKHRPPGNRNPAPDEVVACSPYLLRQLELLKPKVIVAFGTFAAQTLLETKTPIGKLRGHVHLYHGTPLVVTYHPAALLRNSAWKRPTWEDVQLARRILDHAPGA